METKQELAIRESRCLVEFYQQLEALLQRDRRPPIIESRLRLGASGVTVQRFDEVYEIVDRDSGDTWATITFERDRPIFEWAPV